MEYSHVSKEDKERFAKFERTMEDLRLLKCISEDLRKYRKMVKIKKYD